MSDLHLIQHVTYGDVYVARIDNDRIIAISHALSDDDWREADTNHVKANLDLEDVDLEPLDDPEPDTAYRYLSLGVF